MIVTPTHLVDATAGERGPVVRTVLLGTLPLGVLVHRLGHPPAWWACLTVAGTAFLLLTRWRPTWAVLWALGAGGTTVALLGAQTAPWLSVLSLTTLWIWGVGLGALRPDGRPVERAVDRVAFWPAFPVLVLVGLSMVLVRSLKLPLAGAAAASVVAAWGLRWPAAATTLVDRTAGRSRIEKASAAVRAVATAAGRAVTTVVMLVPLLITTIVWLVHRLVRHDVIAGPAPVAGGWVERLGPDQGPERYFAEVAVVDRRPLVQRLSAAAAGLVLLALAAGAVSGVVILQRSEADTELGAARPTPTAQGTTPASASAECSAPPMDGVMDQQPEWATLWCETDAALARAEVYAPALYRLADHSGHTVNIEDGRRLTWAPPACECRRIRIWWFGGSAAWGFFQRDMYSLPSQLARAAWEQGIALDITNYAMPGYVLGQEVRQLADLTTTEAPPDLVVFYDGFNDLMLQGRRAKVGRVADESEVTFMEDAVAALFRDGLTADPSGSVEWTQARMDEEPGDEEAALAPVAAEHAMNRYRRGVDLARRVAGTVGADVAFVFQPVLAGSPESAGGQHALSGRSRAVIQAAVDTARRHLPESVIDLSDAYRGVDHPVFRDAVHTNEEGAAIAANRLLDSLLPRLRTADGASGQGR